MKTKLFLVALFAIVIGFGACGGDDPKSSEKDIKTFSVNGIAYQISGQNITFTYPKTGEPVMPIWPTVPSITYSDKATIEPLVTEAKDFYTVAVKYKVTAEDGSTKEYTVKVEKAMP